MSADDTYHFSIPVFGAVSISVEPVLRREDYEEVREAMLGGFFADIHAPLRDAFTATFHHALPLTESDSAFRETLRDRLHNALKRDGPRGLAAEWQKFCEEDRGPA